jgi:hypothetical protein
VCKHTEEDAHTCLSQVCRLPMQQPHMLYSSVQLTTTCPLCCIITCGAPMCPAWQAACGVQHVVGVNGTAKAS